MHELMIPDLLKISRERRGRKVQDASFNFAYLYAKSRPACP